MGEKRRPWQPTRIGHLPDKLRNPVADLLTAANTAVNEIPRENCYCYGETTPCAIHGLLRDAAAALLKVM